MRTVSGRTDHVVVIGAGLAGVSATVHLLGSGRKVTLLQPQRRPGGRVGHRTADGYSVDTGASVLTMPELLDEAFAAVGEATADSLTLTRLDPAYRAHFVDGSTIAVHTEAAATRGRRVPAASPLADRALRGAAGPLHRRPLRLTARSGAG
jgi:phytoene desaturase